ncbi:hypothetical protein [Solobacterium moorei]|uniref:hypothetical protein n=1 Tax=Solobacterium moorei TaxID=102148 RepID=UPI000416D577|nr:hypothetical protein [Solobacterium moorei]BET20957.1 hypothetical protein RGT18_05450 [Solobacterium moorei]
MKPGDMLLDMIRNMIWFFCKFSFELMDLIYGILKELIGLNLGNFDFIWNWWTGLLVLTGSLIIIRFVFYYLQTITDEEKILKFSPTDVFKKFAILGIVILLMPGFFKGVSGISSGLTKSIGTLITGFDENTKPSSIMVAAGYGGSDVSEVKLDTIDINKLNATKDAYLIYPSAFDIVFAGVSAGVADFLFVFIGIQVAQRIINLLLKILISPWVFSGMFDPDNNTFSIWWKLCLADFLTNFYQMMLVILVLAVTPAVPISALAKVIFFIGALSAVMNAPTGIAQLLGGDVGVGTAFQQMQSLGMISSAMSGIGGVAAGAALTMGASAIYGGGRLAGGTGLLHSAGEALGGLTGGSGGILAGIGNSNSSEGGGTSPLGQIAPSQGTAGGTNGVPGLDDSNMPQSSVNPSMLSGLGSGEGTPRRMTKDGNSIARRIADMNSNSRIGRMVNQAGSSLYQMSANRLSRPVQKRTKDGLVKTRQSHLVSASRAAHGVYDAVKNSAGGDTR